MDSSVGGLSVSLHVITFLFQFLLSSVYADNSSALQSPYYCFDKSSVCSMSVEYPLVRYSYRDDSCGYPGFEVDCDPNKYEGRPFMNISNHIYHVVSIDYKEQLFTLDEESGGGCLQPKRNFSFPFSPSWVSYHSNSGNVTVFYNCSSVPVDAEKHLLCSQEDYKTTNTPPSYAFYDDETIKGFDWYGNCAQNVVVPFRGGFNYSEAVRTGIYMGWSSIGWCEDCESSGGRCWSNSTATGCACRNGKSYNTTCPSGTPPPPPPQQGPRRTPPPPPHHQGSGSVCHTH